MNQPPYSYPWSSQQSNYQPTYPQLYPFGGPVVSASIPPHVRTVQNHPTPPVYNNQPQTRGIPQVPHFEPVYSAAIPNFTTCHPQQRILNAQQGQSIGGGIIAVDRSPAHTPPALCPFTQLGSVSSIQPYQPAVPQGQHPCPIVQQPPQIQQYQPVAQNFSGNMVQPPLISSTEGWMGSTTTYRYGVLPELVMKDHSVYVKIYPRSWYKRGNSQRSIHKFTTENATYRAASQAIMDSWARSSVLVCPYSVVSVSKLQNEVRFDRYLERRSTIAGQVYDKLLDLNFGSKQQAVRRKLAAEMQKSVMTFAETGLYTSLSITTSCEGLFFVALPEDVVKLNEENESILLSEGFGHESFHMPINLFQDVGLAISRAPFQWWQQEGSGYKSLSLAIVRVALGDNILWMGSDAMDTAPPPRLIYGNGRPYTCVVNKFNAGQNGAGNEPVSIFIYDADQLYPELCVKILVRDNKLLFQ